MTTVSFLKEELRNIDSKVNRKITTLNFKKMALVDLIIYAASEEIFYY